ncbi:MAG: HD domain-containing protein [Candidatus Sulfobium sp.]
MSRISELIGIEALRKLVSQYAEGLKADLFLLDREKKVITGVRDDVPHIDLAEKPLLLRESVVGYVAACRENGGQALGFIAENLSGIIEMAYDIESLSGEVARNYEELALLWSISTRLGTGLDVDTICTVLADEMMKLCPVNAVSIFLLGEMPSDRLLPVEPRSAGGAVPPPEKAILFPKVSLGAYSGMASMMTLTADRGLLGYVREKKEPVTIFDVSMDERFEGFPYPVKSLLVVPLIVEDAMIGALIASDKLDGKEFYSTDIKLISGMASACAVSIKKAFLFDDLRGMLFGAAEAFSFAIDAKDPYTYGHSRRVAETAVGIAKEAGFSADMMNWLRLAALLHDIGKIGTPESILHKRGKLDDEEMVMIREHPVIGARMIRHIPRLKSISLWIRHHHEKYDGSGYPSGLKGEEIPFVSRIIAIADCFDALTTDRPYRRALGREEAIDIMRETEAEHFDPVLFGHFEKMTG